MTKILYLFAVFLYMTAQIKDSVEVPIPNPIDEQIITEDVTDSLQEGEIVVPENKIELSDIENSGRDIIVYGDVVDSDKIEELERILDSYSPNISVAAYSLDDSKALIYNGEQEYFSACTIKIPWMLYLCQEIDKGTYNKDTVLTYEERHYHGGSGSIRFGAYGDTYTVEELITLCLSISDNVAYEMLTEYIDREAFDAFTKELGYQSFELNSWSIWSNNSIVRDYLGIWRNVYNYFASETECSKLLKKACTNTSYNYGTLTLVDEDYSHKSGDNFGIHCAYNDAGIVWSEKPYVYAVFTKSEGELYDIEIVNNVMTIVHGLF